MLSDYRLFVRTISMLFVVILLPRGTVDWSSRVIVVEGEVCYQVFVFLLPNSCLTFSLPTMLREGQIDNLHTCIDVSTIIDNSLRLFTPITFATLVVICSSGYRFSLLP